MFLLLTNVALWLFRTFHMKEVELEGHLQEDQYGYLAWQLIMHALVPLLIFFHFHCSACLAHIWSSAFTQPPKKPQNEQRGRAISTNSSIENESSLEENMANTVKKEDLVPDRIIQFKRHGKAPPARRTSIHTIVESMESPADGNNPHTIVFPSEDVAWTGSDGDGSYGGGVSPTTTTNNTHKTPNGEIETHIAIHTDGQV